MESGTNRPGGLTVTSIADGWALCGDIDADTAPRLDEAIQMGHVSADGCLVVDLAGVDFIDSSGLSVLLEARRRADEHGGSLMLRHPSIAVRRLIEITRLETALPIEAEQTSVHEDLPAH
jgi:anti-sigma B factor antagonist